MAATKVSARDLSQKHILRTAVASIALIAVAACGGGGGGSDTAPPPTNPTTPPARVYSTPALENLTIGDVEQIIAQAVAEANAQGQPATIAVVDRVGNVLAVFRMNGATPMEMIRPGPSGDPADNTGAQGVPVPRSMAAISKAITGAYLSSAGNAFSSRTASMIVQEHFPPAPTTVGLESGPLFGVQFSQLPCSDLNTRFGTGAGALIGPKRAPLGLAADPGGLPLYKNGVVVGGIGISADSDYGFDDDVLDTDTDVEELIAVAGAQSFFAAEEIRANRISVDGTTLRFSDATASDLASSPSAAPGFASINGTDGALITVAGYFGDPTPAIQAGTAYGSEASGIRASTSGEFSNADAYVLSNGSGTNRYQVRGGTDAASVAQPLTQSEVNILLEEAFAIMSDARAQIRRPLNSRAEVTISVVDTHGQILGIVRSPDAPIFGTDVSLQKARTAAFFSGANAASDLGSARIGGGNPAPDPNVRRYVQLVRDFLNDPNALTGTVAFADRSGGNLSRPYFPDGEVGTANGPLSLPITEWSIFATGLQTDLIIGNVAQHIGFVTNGGAGNDTRRRCSFIPDVPGTSVNRLQNGIQIFPGSVPIYRDDELIGGIGVSGDGIDQDDMISFLGLHNAGIRTGTINNADPAIRADQIIVPVNGEDIRLRYVSCPFTPFLSSNAQSVCDGK
jgi:uncharacterized protein GlcG (DUF336 family)